MCKSDSFWCRPCQSLLQQRVDSVYNGNISLCYINYFSSLVACYLIPLPHNVLQIF